MQIDFEEFKEWFEGYTVNGENLSPLRSEGVGNKRSFYADPTARKQLGRNKKRRQSKKQQAGEQSRLVEVRSRVNADGDEKGRSDRGRSADDVGRGIGVSDATTRRSSLSTSPSVSETGAGSSSESDDFSVAERPAKDNKKEGKRGLGRGSASVGEWRRRIPAFNSKDKEKKQTKRTRLDEGQEDQEEEEEGTISELDFNTDEDKYRNKRLRRQNSPENRPPGYPESSSGAGSIGFGSIMRGVSSLFPTKSPPDPWRRHDETLRAIAKQEAKTLLFRRARLRAQVSNASALFAPLLVEYRG